MDGRTGELCTAHSAMSSVREPPRKPSSLLHWDSTRCDRNLRHVGASVRVIGNADKGVREGEVAGERASVCMCVLVHEGGVRWGRGGGKGVGHACV